MKNFLHKTACLALIASAGISCSEKASVEQGVEPFSPEEQAGLSVAAVARMLAALPIGKSQLDEVHGAVGSSTGAGYDEEYTMKDLLLNPGGGVGTKAGVPAMRDLIKEYLNARYSETKASGSEAAAYLQALEDSGYQIYWPYADSWDGEQMPLVTFDPGYGAQSNWGYVIGAVNGRFEVTDSVLVTEEIAASRPVWVINHNDDAAFSPLEMYSPTKTATKAPGTRKLVLKSFMMLRNYDSWFQGASEFRIQCGSVEGFSASTEAELKLYNPSVSEFVIVVPRTRLNLEIPYNGIVMTDFTNQLDKLVFLITEDDGGLRTSWKCSATVKIKSKSYGFDLDLPFNQKDDVVWRGQLAASFFQEEDIVTGRFGDLLIRFALE